MENITSLLPMYNGDIEELKSSLDSSLVSSIYVRTGPMNSGKTSELITKCKEFELQGLPCIIIANELHEIESAEFLSQLGSSIFAGYFDNIDLQYFDKALDIEKMSKIGLENIQSNNTEKIYKEINDL